MRTLGPDDKDYCRDITAPCFAALGPEELALIRESKTQVVFHKGETMIKQGAFASYVLFISEGVARQFVEADGARNLNLRLRQAGEFSGLSAVFTDRKFSYSLTALSETRVFLIETEAIAQLMQHNAAFSYRIARRYCSDHVGFFDQMHHLVYKQLNGRMADVLLYVDLFKAQHPDVFALMSRKDIAEFAGMSTESAVKILKSFEKDGLIHLEDKDIQVLRAEKLKSIADLG